MRETWQVCSDARVVGSYATNSDSRCRTTTQASDPSNSSGRWGVDVGDLSQSGVVDIEQLGSYHVTLLVLIRTQRRRYCMPPPVQ